jgi:hypothetical protein
MIKPQLIFVKYSKSINYLVRIVQQSLQRIYRWRGTTWLITNPSVTIVPGGWKLTIMGRPHSGTVTTFDSSGVFGTFPIYDTLTTQQQKKLGNPLLITMTNTGEEIWSQ